MKNKHFISSCVIVCLELFFLFSAFYLYQFVLSSVSEISLKHTITFLVVQNLILAVLSLAVYLYLIIQDRKKMSVSPFQSLKIMTYSGELKEEIILIDKQALFIAGKERKEIFVKNIETGYSEQIEYAVLNLVSGYWYIEAMSKQYPIGLKKENESMVYKLKPEIPYKLSKNDIIYVNASKILVN